MARPLLIWGAGAVGATLGAHLARAGVDVLLVDSHAEHVARCNADGLVIEGPVDAFTVAVRACEPHQLDGCYPRVVLAVKAQHTMQAAEQLSTHLAEDGFVLSAQNGLNGPALARQVGASQVMGAFVNFGADWLAPGRILFGNRGAVVVGELDGATRSRTHSMHALLQLFEPDALLSDNVEGYLWGKMGYGAMLFATALCNDSMHDNFADPRREVIWLTLAREVMAVAGSQGVRPLGFNGFEPAAFTGDAPARAGTRCIEALARFTRDTAKTHSGIWRDLSVRKRATEAAGFFAPVLELAAAQGIATPALLALARLIAQVERGERAQSFETLMTLRDVCASTSASVA